MRLLRLLLILLPVFAIAQGSYLPLGSYSMHMLDRMEIKQGRIANPWEFNTSTKAYQRDRIALYVDSFQHTQQDLSPQDQFNLRYLKNETFEYRTIDPQQRGWFNTKLFQQPGAALYYQPTDLTVILNPVLYLQTQYDSKLQSMAYINTRGMEIRGTIGKRIGFYTMLSDEIHKANSWDRRYFLDNQVIAGGSFLNGVEVDTNGVKPFNYWIGSGYLSIQAGKYTDIQFGHGKNFLGNGYRSLIFSDFSPEHLFLRLNTRIWKINYTNIWGQIYDFTPFTGRTFAGRHYYATTHASINFTKRFNLGLFQNFSFQRDSGFGSTGFDAQYLNPIIFYKPVENALNSPDNAIVGLDWKYNFRNAFSFYGQFALSEIRFSNIFDGSGWWGNQFAWQLGLKYIDVFNIANLDLQLEYNQVAPYMYTSFDTKNKWINLNQNMAHPLGANFREGVSIIRYQPTNRLSIQLRGIVSTFGNDTNGSNWGRNIGLDYNTRMREFDNFVGQGVRTTLWIGESSFSYMLFHNLFIDLQVVYRNQTSELPQFRSETLNGGIALRWNMSQRFCHY